MITAPRWAVLTVAVVVAAVGGVRVVPWAAAATSTGDRAIFEPLPPARILDTRSPSNPLGPGESRVLQVTGAGGVPADATAVVLNVTVTTPTAGGFLTVFPADLASPPNASNLNFGPGQTVPNSVTVRLGTGADLGKVKIFNFAGSTHVIVDVGGYFRGHDHDDRYYTKAQIDAQTHIALADQRFSLMWVSAGAPESAAIREDASIRFTSDPGIVVTRVSTGHYCIQVNAPQEGAVGTLQDKSSTHGTIDVTMGIGSPCAAAPGAQISVQTWQIT